jgi:hypothetical protein
MDKNALKAYAEHLQANNDELSETKKLSGEIAV